MALQRMTRWLWTFYLIVSLTLTWAAGNAQETLKTGKKQPNILFILTDDQDSHMNSLDYMPSLKKHITNYGTTYTRHYCTVALCCPSRASMWTGKAAHNTNVTDLSPPYGGYPQFINNGFNDKYLPIWLQAAGYNTYYTGKFLNSQSVNNYDKPHAAGWTGSDFQLDPFTYQYYNATFQRNHDLPINHEGEYSVDLVTQKALGFLDDAVEAGKPFFLTAAPIAPHSHVIIGGYYVNSTYYNETSSTQAPPVPAKRHAHLFPNANVPRTPSFNPAEPNGVAWISTLPRQNQTNIDYNDSWYRNRLRTLQSVDEMIDALIAKLTALNILDDTYVFFSTDNGYHIGQHRLQPGKQCAYQEDVNIPLIVRGPGVARNVSTELVSSHTDMVPTFLTLAGAPVNSSYFDGQPIPITAAQLHAHESSPDRSDEHVNIEMWGIIVSEGKYGQILYPNHTYKALRLVGEGYNFLYTVWCTGAHELYDLNRDPYETNNLYPPHPQPYQALKTTIPLTVSAGATAGKQRYTSSFTSAVLDGFTDVSNATILETTTLTRLLPRLDALVLVLKTCSARACTHPWEVLHPEGNVHNLREALNPQYDYFYEVQENRVKFDKCLSGYFIDNELPIKVKPYMGDYGA